MKREKGGKQNTEEGVEMNTQTHKTRGKSLAARGS